MKRLKLYFCECCWRFGHRPKLSMLLEPLYILLNQALSLSQALQILESSSESIIIRYAISKIRHLMHNGAPFSQAIATCCKKPKAYEMSLIAIGEQSQQLNNVLKQLHDHNTHIKTLRSHMIQACFHPCLNLFIALFISSMLLTTTLPTCFEMFQAQSLQLPKLTQKLITLNHWLNDNGTYCVFGILISLCCICSVMKKPSVQICCEKMSMYFPIWHQLILPMRYSNIANILFLGLSQQLSFKQTIEFTANSQKHFPTKKALKTWLYHLEQGHPYHTAIALVPSLPNQLKQWIKLSTNQDQLAKNMQQLSQYYLKMSKQKSENLSRWLNPVLMITTSAIIGTIMIGIYMPLFELGNVLQ